MSATAMVLGGLLGALDVGTAHATAPDDRGLADEVRSGPDGSVGRTLPLGLLSAPEVMAPGAHPEMVEPDHAAPRLRSGDTGPDAGGSIGTDGLGREVDAPDQGIIGGEDDILTIDTTKGPCGPSLTFTDGELAYFRFQSKQAGPLDIYYAGPRGETHFTRIDLPAYTRYRYTPTIDAAAGGARMVVRMVQPGNRAQAYCSFTVEASVSSLCAWSTSMFAECGTRIYETEFESCATGRLYWYEGELEVDLAGKKADSLEGRATDESAAGAMYAPSVAPDSEIPSLWSFEGPRVAWDPDCYSYMLTGYSRARLIGFAPSVSCSDCPSTRDHGGTINVWTQRGSFYQCDGVFQRGETVRIYVRAGQSGTATLTIRHSDDKHSTISLGRLVAGILYIGDLVVDHEPPGRQVMFVQQAANRAFDSCSYVVDSPRMCTTVGSLSVETFPTEPIAGSPFTILVSGTALDGCMPGALVARLRGGFIELDLEWGGCSRSCGGGPTPWEREAVMTIPFADEFPTTVAMTCGGRSEVCDDGLITVREPKPVIVLLPGIAGSVLETDSTIGERTGQAWPNISELLLSFRRADMKAAYLTGLDTLRLRNDGIQAANPADTVTAAEPFWEVPIGGSWLGDYYATLRDTIDDEGWGTLVPCAYDWRIAIDSVKVMNTVAACVAEARAASEGEVLLDADGERLPVPEGPIILLGHSLGGLVARSYVSEAARAAGIDRVITVGSPYLGAPASYARLPIGKTGSTVIDMAGNDVALALLAVYQNAPAPLYLLPSSDYGGSPLLYSNGSPLAHSRQLSLFADWGFDRALLVRARSLHRRLDDLSVDAHVPTNILASSANRQTPFAVNVTSRRVQKGRRINVSRSSETLSKVPGDGTVPLVSAMANPSRTDVFRPGDAHVCVYSSAGLADGKDHGELMADGNIIDDIRRLAYGEPAEHCTTIHGGTAEELRDGVTETADVMSDLLDDAPVAYEVDIFGAPSVLAEDKGSRAKLGVDVDGNVFADWSGAELHSIGDGAHQLTFADDVRSGEVAISFAADVDLEREITLRRYESDSDETLTVSDRLRFVDVPDAPADGTYRLIVPVDPDESPMLEIRNAAGRVIRILSPSYELSGEDALDIEPPTVTLDYDDGRNPRVIVTAVDGGSGVDEVLFSLDDGETWNEYEAPIAISAGFRGTVRAIAVDRAGNMSWPPAEIDVSRGGGVIYLPHALLLSEL